MWFAQVVYATNGRMGRWKYRGPAYWEEMRPYVSWLTATDVMIVVCVCPD